MKIWLSYSTLCGKLLRGIHPGEDDRFFFGCCSSIIGKDPYHPDAEESRYAEILPIAKKYYDKAEHKMCSGDLKIREDYSERSKWEALAKLSGRYYEFMGLLGDYYLGYNYPKAAEILTLLNIEAVW